LVQDSADCTRRFQESNCPGTLPSEKGAIIAEIAKATNWQNHSIREGISVTDRLHDVTSRVRIDRVIDLVDSGV